MHKVFKDADSWQVPEFSIREYSEKRTKYCICIFVINEHPRLRMQLEKMGAQASLADIIIADGGSSDATTDEANTKPFGVRTVLTKMGSGKLGAQMRMAFAYACIQGYEGVVTVDGNGKDDVTSGLPFFISRLEAGYDNIQGSRFILGGKHSNTPFSRLLGVKMLHAPLISLASGFRYTDTTNGFRAYSRKLLEDKKMAIFRDELSGYELHYYIAIEAVKNNFRTCEVPVSRTYPATGKVPTKISPLRGNAKVLATLFKAVLGFYKA